VLLSLGVPRLVKRPRIFNPRLESSLSLLLALYPVRLRIGKKLASNALEALPTALDIHLSLSQLRIASFTLLEITKAALSPSRIIAQRSPQPVP
jgi:hypothetical protein